jgi:hypothetical protein
MFLAITILTVVLTITAAYQLTTMICESDEREVESIYRYED